MNRFKTYVLVAKIWTFVFLAVGLIFLFIPNFLEVQINELAGVLSFKGKLSLETKNLWHILSLSLMGLLVAVAYLSASFPQNKYLFLSIVLAKSISVIGFSYLAISEGSAWFIAAVADFFVAITLAIAYPKEEKSNAFLNGFYRKMFAQIPYYEVWFGKVDIAPDKAFWFRYTLLNGKRQEASTWAILFDNEAIKTGKETYPIHLVATSNEISIPDEKKYKRFENKKQVFHLGRHYLDSSNAIGYAGNISWDLQFTTNNKQFEHVPPLVKYLGIAKSIYNACFIDLRFSGQVQIGDKVIELKDRPGMIGHIYGKKSAHSWAWAHCNNFANANDIVFEGLSAKIVIGGKVSPPLTSLVLIRGEEVIAFSSTKHLFKTKSHFNEGRWDFEANSPTYTLKGNSIAHDKVAIVEYTDTDDSNLWCYNSKVASLSLTLIDKRSGKEEMYISEKTTAFEIVNRIKPQEKSIFRHEL